jgi:hypothetical protein
MAQTRVMLPNTEAKLRTAKAKDMVNECIYAVCVGYKSSHTPAEVLSVVKKIHELGMMPILYTEENLAFPLSFIEVMPEVDLRQVGTAIARTENTAVIIKQKDSYFIYGVSKAKQWELKKLPDLQDLLHNKFSFSQQVTVVSASNIKSALYDAIKEIDGHGELNKWLMENQEAINFIKEVGGEYQEMTEWEQEPAWQAMYKKLDTALTLPQFSKIKNASIKDAAKFVSSRGKYLGVSVENAREHILKCAVHVLCMASQSPEVRAMMKAKSSETRVLMCTDLAECVKEMLEKQAGYFGADKKLLKIIMFNLCAPSDTMKISPVPIPESQDESVQKATSPKTVHRSSFNDEELSQDVAVAIGVIKQYCEQNRFEELRGFLDALQKIPELCRSASIASVIQLQAENNTKSMLKLLETLKLSSSPYSSPRIEDLSLGEPDDSPILSKRNSQSSEGGSLSISTTLTSSPLSSPPGSQSSSPQGSPTKKALTYFIAGSKRFWESDSGPQNGSTNPAKTYARKIEYS